jgi:hypothetical protein
VPLPGSRSAGGADVVPVLVEHGTGNVAELQVGQLADEASCAREPPLQGAALPTATVIRQRPARRIR